jgi:hypothetical protein
LEAILTINTIAITLAAALLAACAATAQAAPFATTYHGTIGTSEIPGINAGEPYSMTLIMDNQGNSASGQTWTVAHLTCALLRFNTGATANVTADFTAISPMDRGELRTNAAGGMTHMLLSLHELFQPGQYSATGVGLVAQLSLDALAPPNSAVLVNGGRRVHDAAGGVNMSPGGWSSPVAVAGACDDTPLAPPPPRPGAPPGATAQPGNGQVTVHWQVPAGSAPPLSYTAYTYDPDGFARSCTVDHPATSCTVTSLANDHPYTFAVTAAAPGSRPSAPSNSVTATPRAAGPGPAGAQPVPALGLPALALLAAGAAALGARRLRRSNS